MECCDYQNIVQFKQRKILPSSFSSNKANFISKANRYSITKKGILKYKKKIVLQKDELDEIFAEMHGHSGRDKTYKRIR